MVVSKLRRRLGLCVPPVRGEATRITTRTLRLCLPVGLLGLLVLAGTASARASVTTFSQTETITAPDVSLCTGLSGTVTNTVTEAFRIVDAGGTFHVFVTTTQDYRTVWSDGSYLVSHSPSHFEFNTNSSGQVFTEAQQDRGTLYTADGQVIGQQTVFTLTHETWRDANGNSELDPGEVTTSIDRFRVTCS